MSLRLKINLIVGVLTLVFLLGVVALQWRGMRASVHEEVVAANLVATQLLNRTAWRYQEQGLPAILGFLQNVGRVRSNDITLYDVDGRELYRSPPSVYKAGRDAPAWFEALVSPPPSVRTIDFSGARLVVHSNASRAALDAWDDALLLLAGLLALFAALNGLVFWVLGRTVRPFGQIVAALNTLEAGRFDINLPRFKGTEAAAIGAAFNRMVGVLRENIAAEHRAARAERQLSDNRELSRWIEHHVEQERRMIARELHDELAQSVTAIRSMALAIVQVNDPKSEPAARLIAEEAARLYDAMHGLIPRLTPLVLDKFGLVEALGDLVERTQRAHAGLQIELELDLADVKLHDDVALALYRAAQEGITNALRHGQARHLRLVLGQRDERIELLLLDDGSGLAQDWSQRGGHYGLRWLTERVQSLHGEVRVAARAPHGVALRVTLPLELA